MVMKTWLRLRCTQSWSDQFEAFGQQQWTVESVWPRLSGGGDKGEPRSTYSPSSSPCSICFDYSLKTLNQAQKLIDSICNSISNLKYYFNQIFIKKQNWFIKNWFIKNHGHGQQFNWLLCLFASCFQTKCLILICLFVKVITSTMAQYTHVIN